MPRMTLPLIDDQGTLSIFPGQKREPWSSVIASERQDSYGYWSFQVEPVMGWPGWSWLVTINGHAYLVDGDEPKDPGL